MVLQSKRSAALMQSIPCIMIEGEELEVELEIRYLGSINSADGYLMQYSEVEADACLMEKSMSEACTRRENEVADDRNSTSICCRSSCSAHTSIGMEVQVLDFIDQLNCSGNTDGKHLRTSTESRGHREIDIVVMILNLMCQADM